MFEKLAARLEELGIAKAEEEMKGKEMSGERGRCWGRGGVENPGADRA